jgi:hypothetical protein
MPDHEKPPRRHLNPKHRPKPHNAYVLLDVKTPTIVPGMPASVEWSIYFPRSESFDLGGTVIAEIYLMPDDARVYVSPEIPYEPNEKLIKPVTLSIPDYLYKIGTKTVLLEVTGDGEDPGPYRADGSLTIVRERLAPDWWEWKVPVSNNVNWKESYTLRGNFINQSRWVQMNNIDIQLSEWNKTDDPSMTFNPKARENIRALDHDESKAITFPAIKQDWGWFSIPTFIFKEGQGDKDFVYRVTFSLEDSFGNTYPEVESTFVSYHVKVSDQKIAASIAAATAFGLSVFYAAAAALAAAGIFTAWAAGPAAATSAFFASAAATSGAIANDPPEPDPRFLETIVPRPVAIPKVLYIGSDPGLVPLLQLIWDILASVEVLSPIQGRFIAARNANNIDGIRIQKTSYINIVSRLGDYISQLRETMSYAKETIGESFPLPENIPMMLDKIQKEDLPRDVCKILINSGVSDEVLLELESIIQHPSSLDKIRTINPYNGIERIVSVLDFLVQGIKQETPVILSDSTVVDNSS